MSEITIHVYSMTGKPSRVLVVTRKAQVLHDRVLSQSGKAYAQDYANGVVDGFSSIGLTVNVRHHPMVLETSG